VLRQFRELRFFALVALMVVFSVGIATGDDPVALAEKVLSAARAGMPFPVFAGDAPSLDLEGAYAVQKIYADRRLEGKNPDAFKAGLTTEATQRRFGASGPVAGVLFPEGRKDFLPEEPEPEISLGDFGKLMLETEVAFILGEPVTEPLKDEAEFRKKVVFLAPAIELPDLAFADMKAMKVTDIIASSVSAKAYLLGKPVPSDAVDPNSVEVVLAKEGREVNRGRGSDALGDQWRAVLWLVNELLRLGWIFDAGDALLTGALGNMIPGEEGRYSADFGPLGSLSFRIVP
jgi:2-keto-4-pentenoate hydratase